MSDLISRDAVIEVLMETIAPPSVTLDTLVMRVDAIPSAFKKEYEKLLPCTCGCKRREHWSKYADGGIMTGLKCIKCGKTVWGKSEVDARREWNRIIREDGEEE